MKIVNAVWEKRNMGISCIEAHIEEKDAAPEIIANLSENEAQYMVVKIPSTRVDLLFTLSKEGYIFIETMFGLFMKLDCIHGSMPDKFSSIKYSLMADGDIEQVYFEIESGMFSTDRISLDPHFSPKQVSDRYKGWIEDELARGAQLLNIMDQDISIGFCAFRKLTNDTYLEFLNGLYPAFHGKGLGLVLVSCLGSYIIESGGKFFTASISSNNIPSLKNHLRYGCLPDSIEYVLVKHNMSL
ncbi:MAG: hypothetical protein LBU84_07790 [Prevotella sp.]|jgi:hypothetical protein|nr:hypothetical protein [Prevotella sp.]